MTSNSVIHLVVGLIVTGYMVKIAPHFTNIKTVIDWAGTYTATLVLALLVTEIVLSLVEVFLDED